jgi:hypothetical protein
MAMPSRSVEEVAVPNGCRKRRLTTGTAMLQNILSPGVRQNTSGVDSQDEVSRDE